MGGWFCCRTGRVVCPGLGGRLCGASCTACDCLHVVVVVEVVVAAREPGDTPRTLHCTLWTALCVRTPCTGSAYCAVRRSTYFTAQQGPATMVACGRTPGHPDMHLTPYTCLGARAGEQVKQGGAHASPQGSVTCQCKLSQPSAAHVWVWGSGGAVFGCPVNSSSSSSPGPRSCVLWLCHLQLLGATELRACRWCCAPAHTLLEWHNSLMFVA